MKIIFIALSIIFFSACSNVEVSGYTESIVKNAKNSVSSSSSEKESKSEETKISALEEDLSSLDDESLREKLLNYYPWPKPKAEPTFDETEPLSYDDYDTPSVIDQFEWKETKVSFNEVSEYEYGFDRDPTDKDTIVYISVYQKTPEQAKPDSKAKFIPIFNTKAYSNFILRHQESNLEQIKEEKELLNNTEVELENSGTFVLYGKGRKTWIPLANKIVVIPYDKITKNIILIEMNGEKTLTENEKSENNFITSQSTKNGFNKVFSQALIYANINESNSSKSFANISKNLKDLLKKGDKYPNISKNDDNITIEWVGKDNIVDVNMTNLNAVDYFIVEKIYNTASILKSQNENKDSPFWHVIYAINKERKYWVLDDCPDGLNACNKFKPESEIIDIESDPSDTESEPVDKVPYKLVSLNKDQCSNAKAGLSINWNDKNLKTEDVIIRVSKADKKTYHIFNKKTKTIISNYNCKILYTDEGTPILPHRKAVFSNGYALASYLNDFKSLTKNKLGFDFSKVQLNTFDNFLPYGSVIFVPKGKSVEEANQYPVYHELGHSFGLTDVSLSDFFREYNKGIPTGEKYASSETNLMSWEVPIGKKLRYRNTIPVCTGGTLYYQGNKENTYFFGAVERPLETGRERQWDCIRGECYNLELTNKYPSKYYIPEFDKKKETAYLHGFFSDDYSYESIPTFPEEYYLYRYPGFSNDARKKHWLHYGECDAKVQTLYNQSQYVYDLALEESLKGKYIAR